MIPMPSASALPTSGASWGWYPRASSGCVRFAVPRRSTHAFHSSLECPAAGARRRRCRPHRPCAPGDVIASLQARAIRNKHAPQTIRVSAADQRRFLGMVPWCEQWRFMRFAVPHPSTHGFYPLEGGQLKCAETLSHYTQALTRTLSLHRTKTPIIDLNSVCLSVMCKQFCTPLLTAFKWVKSVRGRMGHGKTYKPP